MSIRLPVFRATVANGDGSRQSTAVHAASRLWCVTCLLVGASERSDECAEITYIVITVKDYYDLSFFPDDCGRASAGPGGVPTR